MNNTITFEELPPGLTKMTSINMRETTRPGPQLRPFSVEDGGSNWLWA